MYDTIWVCTVTVTGSYQTLEISYSVEKVDKPSKKKVLSLNTLVLLSFPAEQKEIVHALYQKRNERILGGKISVESRLPRW